MGKLVFRVMFSDRDFIDKKTGKACDPEIIAMLPDGQATPVFYAGDTGEDNYYEINLIDEPTQNLDIRFSNKGNDLGQITIPVEKMVNSAGEWIVDEVIGIATNEEEIKEVIKEDVKAGSNKQDEKEELKDD